MPNHNTNNKKKKSRRRTNREIGLGSAAIAQYDQEQALQEAYEAARAAEATRDKPAYLSEFPSFHDLTHNFKRAEQADAWGNDLLRRDPDDGRWKLVVTVENMHRTFLGNAHKLKEQRGGSLTFVQFKEYMKQRYAVDDELLDCFVDKKQDDNKNNDNTSKNNGDDNKNKAT